MKIIIKRWATVLLLLLFVIKSQCGNEFIELRAVSPKGGFTFGSIHQITEDSHGFIWFGSHHGLFRYNTETIDKYVHIPTNKNSIPSNVINSITKDSKNTLWFATDNGICFFNEPKENFERCIFYNSNKEPLPNNTSQIIAIENNLMWVLSDRKLHLVNTEDYSFDLIETDPQDNLSTFIYLDKNKRLWVRSSTSKIYWADAPYSQFNLFGQVASQNILSMLFTKNILWIGYESYGVECYDIYGKLLTKYGRTSEEGIEIKSNRVRKIFEDKQGRIWLATYNGIIIIDNGVITQHNVKNTPGLMHSSVYDIFTDSRNGTWIGTWSGTLSYANPSGNTFEHLNVENGLSNNVVSSVAEWNGFVWIGTEGGGLNSYNPSTGEIFNHQLNPSLNDEQNVKALEIDNNNRLWVGTFNDGLWLIRDSDGNGRPRNTQKVIQGGFYHLRKEGKYIWAATYFRGLYKIDTETFESENFRGDINNKKTVISDNLRRVLIDSQGGLWVGSQAGLCYRKKGDDIFTRFVPNPSDTSSLSGAQIYSIYEDHKKTIWIGTASGLSRYNAENNSFVNFTPNEGMSGYEIYGITEDNNKNLWISTDNGITEFNTTKNTFRYFNVADGLQGNQFNPGAVYKSPSGKIYFGGPNGLNIFHPEKIKTNNIAPQPIITSISINNQLQVPSDKSGMIKESVLSSNRFKLKHDQNSITFHFVANNFLNSRKNTFSYRLLNYDDNWINAGSNRSATFTKIPPGTYTFQLKAANNDGIWNDTPAEIELYIKAPWWKRWYSYTAYLIIVLVITFFIQREILIKKQLHNEVLLEKIKSQSEQELNQAKLTFFTNISHEIKTPLSLILSPIDFLIEKRRNDTELVDSLKMIKRNGNRLNQLLHQVIDIRRIDAGKLAFTPGNYNIVSILNEMISCFAIEAREREIDFRLETEYESLFTSIDPDKFDKIIFNLLTNAFKFVPDQGEIVVSLQKDNNAKSYLIGHPIDGEYFEVQVWNNGSYIPGEEFQSIFERFFQGKDNIKNGTGIGLHMVREYTNLHRGQIDVSSDEKRGTGFTVRIPMNMSTETIAKTDGKMVSQPTNSTLGKQFSPQETNHDDKRKLILVVEDNTELRAFLKKSLSAAYTVITAPNGQRGFEQALELNPDLIVSDVMMPIMNGLELCEKIKNDINTSHIPFILLTALTSEESQIEGYSKGADAYIAKPFSEKLLLTQIDNLLQNRRKLKERFLDPDASILDSDPGNSDLLLIDKAISIVEEHLLDPNFSVELLADKLKMSRTSLHRKLKAHTDQSATEFIRFVRLKKALKMLKSGNYSIDEVSFTVGFNSPSYFSQSFKKQFGKSPKEYVQQND